MKLDLIDISVKKCCSFCFSEDSKLISKFTQVPAFLGCSIRSHDEDVFFDFEVFECQKCYLIETESNINEFSYSELHSEAVGPKWDRHHKKFLDYISSKAKSFSKILEIGPSSRPLVKNFKEDVGQVIYCDVIDNLPFSLSDNESYVKKFFPNDDVGFDFDLIFASHVFEHALNPSDFIRKGLLKLNSKGKLIISIPNFKEWIGKKYWNAITPEHTIYPFVTHINDLAKENNVDLSFEYFENHSIFFCFDKEKNYSEIVVDDAINGLSLDWAKSLIDAARNVELKLADISDSAEIVIVGASHLSEYPLLMSDIIDSKVDYVIDNSTFKKGKRLYGTSKLTNTFESVADLKNPVAIIFSSPYEDEMREQLFNINPNIKIIFQR